MKKTILAGLLAMEMVCAHAQPFRGGFGRPFHGGYHHYGGGGIGIGIGTGLVLGALLSDRYYYSPPVVYAPGPVYYAPSPYYDVYRPNYAVTGTVLGGVAGGIIGHNTGLHTGAGIAIGAGTGLLFGSLAEQPARRSAVGQVIQSAPVYAASPQAAPASQQPVPAPAPIVSAPFERPPTMAGANSLFGR